MRTISLLKDNKFSDETYVDYSKFKHGSKNVARKFGKGLAKKIIEDNFLEGIKNLIIYPAPYKNIPTASSALKDYLLASLSMDFLQKGISVKEGKIYRQYSYDNDYGQMSKEERDKAISSDIFSIDKNFIDPTDTLVFIDDIKITGSHEERIKELLKREEITEGLRLLKINI